MKSENKNRYLTEGSIGKGIIIFAFPIFISNLFQQLYSAVDTLIVGKFLGSEALAAVGSSGNLIFLMVGFSVGLSMGAGVVTARYFGADNKDALVKSIDAALFIAFICGVFLSFAGVFFTPFILRLMGTPDSVIGYSTIYFKIYFAGSISMAFFNMCSALLQSLGDSKSPMIYLIEASFLNVALDYIFIGVFHGGVGYAALATIISETLSAVLSIRKLIKTGVVKSFGLSIDRSRLHYILVILKQGVPSGIQNSVISIANTIVQANINSFGALAMAGCASYAKLEGFAFLPINCFALALSTFISQNIGAGKYKRMKKGIGFSLVSSLLIAEFIGLITYFFAPYMLKLFTNDPKVLSYGILNAKVMSLFYFLLAFSHCCAGIMRGIEKATVPMAIMLIVWCLIRVMYINLILDFIPDIRCIFWAYPLTWFISSLLFAYFLIKDVLSIYK